MKLFNLSGLCATLLLAGCASESNSQPLAMDHPANPQAMQVSYVPPASVLDLNAVDSTVSGAGATSTAKREQASAQAPVDHSQHAQTPQAAAPKVDEHEGHEGKAVEVVHATQEKVDALLKAYLTLSSMLAEDKIKGAADQLTAIREAAKGLTEAKETALRPLAEKIVKATPQGADDLEATRTAFKGLSQAVIDLTYVAPPTNKVAPIVYQAFCPHAKASWLQLNEKVTNPYYGSEMLGCGKVTRKIQPAKGHEH